MFNETLGGEHVHQLQGRVYPSPLSISFHWSSGAVLAAAVCSVLRRRKGKLPRAQGFSYAVNDFATPRRDSGEKQWLISTLHERKMRNTNWKFEVGKRCHALLGLFGKSYWSCSSCFQPRELFPSCKDHLGWEMSSGLRVFGRSRRITMCGARAGWSAPFLSRL